MTKPAVIPLKIGIFGGQGSGKSTTAALIAASLSKEIHNGAPIWVTDTEPAWQFVRPRIFLPEKVELVQKTVPTFAGMLRDIRDAERAGACVYVVDQLTTMWQEIMQSYKAKNKGFIPINVWGDLRQTWNEYVTAFRNSKMHCIAIGRLGNVMEEIQDEDKEGKTKLIKTGTAFKAGGSESFGYEPDLLFELSLERKAKKVRGEEREGEGRMIHRADVLKDRTWTLNGRVLRWPDKPKYEAGGYRVVWADLKPHFDFVQQTGEQTMIQPGNSECVIPDDGRGDYYHAQQLRQVALEEWDGTMEHVFSGSTAAMKTARRIVGEAITGVRSRTAFENKPIGDVQSAVKVLMLLEKRLKLEPVTTEADLLAMVEMAKEDFTHPGKNSTLLEARLQESLKQTGEEYVETPF